MQKRDKREDHAYVLCNLNYTVNARELFRYTNINIINKNKIFLYLYRNFVHNFFILFLIFYLINIFCKVEQFKKQFLIL